MCSTSPAPSLVRSDCGGPGKDTRYAFHFSSLSALTCKPPKYVPDLSPVQSAVLSLPEPLRDLSKLQLIRRRPGPLLLLERACWLAVPDVARLLSAPESNRIDYSFNNPSRSLRALRLSEPSRHLENPLTARTGRAWRHSLAIVDAFPSFASITAKVIQNEWRLNTQEPAHLPQFKEPERLLLSKWGLDESFPCWWADVVATPSLERALNMLAPHVDALRPETARTVPLFLILFLLRREKISARSLQRLLAFSWRIIRNNESIREQQVFILFIRLMRHSRRVWQRGILNITALITTFIPLRHSDLSSPLSQIRYLRFCDMFNCALAVLAIPPRRAPYETNELRVLAQSMVLTRMVRFEKPLSLNSSGFRGLLRTQLARPKNSKEQSWSSLQSRAWPPYLEPKTHMDEGKGFDDGASRALLTQMHMRRAGYAFPAWDRIVRIFAGWDVDYSPTVQTRKVLENIHPDVKNEQASIFAARINVTRDIKEAWSFFLQYYESQLPGDCAVYEAIFRKVKAEDNRNKMLGVSRFEAGQVPAGDSLELLQAAASPRQRVYTATKPDTVMELFHRMLSDGVRPRPHLRAQLISWAPDLSTAVMIWHFLSGPSTKSFTMHACADEGAGGMGRLELGAFVRKLAKNPLSREAAALFDADEKESIRNLFQGPASGLHEEFRLDWIPDLGDCALFQAFYLLQQAHGTLKCDGDDWGRIFQGVKTIVAENRGNVLGMTSRWLGVVDKVLDVVSGSSTMFESLHFLDLCTFVEFIARGARVSFFKSMLSPAGSHPLLAPPQIALVAASRTLRRAFALMTATSATESELAAATAGLPDATPPIPRVPTLLRPQFFHVYVRALMLCDDHEGVYSFLRWIAAHEAEVREAVDASTAGAYFWRRFVSVARLEVDKARYAGRARSHYGLRDADPMLVSDVAGPTPELALLMRECLVGLTALRGWATDDEVAQYLGYSRYPDEGSYIAYHKTKK